MGIITLPLQGWESKCSCLKNHSWGQGGLKKEGIYRDIHIYLQLQLGHIVIWQKATQHCEVIALQLKEKESHSV